MESSFCGPSQFDYQFSTEDLENAGKDLAYICLSFTTSNMIAKNMLVVGNFLRTWDK